jgi:hypothetical protein
MKKDRYKLVLEGLKNDFKIFGKNLKLLSENINKLNQKLDCMNTRFERKKCVIV